MTRRCYHSLIFLLLIVFSPIHFAYSNIIYDSYRIPLFWDNALNYCYYQQDTDLSCGPACIRMTLDFLEVDPLPTQEQIANEMNRKITNVTHMAEFYIVYENRNINAYFKKYSNNFEQSSNELKTLISYNHPIILRTNYSLAKESMHHFRVLTGYNESGFFMHDPSYSDKYQGNNVFFTYSLTKDLWEDGEYMALIVQNSTIEKRIIITDGGVSKHSTLIGKSQTIWFKAEYEFTFEVFDGTCGLLYVNGDQMEWSLNNDKWEKSHSYDEPTSRTFRVSGVKDNKYNTIILKDEVGSQSIKWKKLLPLIIDQIYSVIKNIVKIIQRTF